MISWPARIWFAFLAVLLVCSVATPGQAQSYQYGNGYVIQPSHHDHVLIDPHGHRVVQHHDTYQYVIPSYQPSQGTYYTRDDVRYYTPPARVVGGQTSYVAPQQYTFGGFSHVDDLASRIVTAANEVCLDLHYNYQPNPGFADTYREAYSVLQQAKAIHSAEHHQDRNAMRQIVLNLDGLLHHVGDDLQSFRAYPQRQIGQYSLPEKMAQLDSMVHHLMYDIGVQDPGHDDGDAPPPGGLEQAPPPQGFNPGGQGGVPYGGQLQQSFPPRNQGGSPYNSVPSSGYGSGSGYNSGAQSGSPYNSAPPQGFAPGNQGLNSPPPATVPYSRQ